MRRMSWWIGAALLFAGQPADLASQEGRSVALGAGVGLASGAFRVFDSYRGELGSDVSFDVRLDHSFGSALQFHARGGFSILSFLSVVDCGASCREVREVGGTVLSAGAGLGVRLTSRVTTSAGLGLAKFVGPANGDDYCAVLPSGCFNPRAFAESPATFGFEAGVRYGITDRLGLEVLDLVAPQAGPGGSGFSHRMRILVSWIVARPGRGRAGPSGRGVRQRVSRRGWRGVGEADRHPGELRGRATWRCRGVPLELREHPGSPDRVPG